MTHDNENQQTRSARGLGLSTAQVTGSALAAMSGAFFASWAGTTGTLIGAAVGSMIATVGAATYTWSLRRTSDAVKRTAAQVRQTTLVPSTLPRTVPGEPRRAGADEQQSAAVGERPPKHRGLDLPWPRLAIASLVVMVLGMAGITVVEVVTGQPIGTSLGRDDSTGTTVGRVVGSARTPSTQKKESRDIVPARPEPTPEEDHSHEAEPEPPAPSTEPDPVEPTTPEVPVPPAGSEVPEPDGSQP